jgi:hypothetical protein
MSKEIAKGDIECAYPNLRSFVKQQRKTQELWK